MASFDPRASATRLPQRDHAHHVTARSAVADHEAARMHAPAWRTPLQLVEHLSADKVKGWPIKLGKGVPNSGGGGGGGGGGSGGGGGGGSSGGGNGSEAPVDLPYFHDASKAEAEAAIADFDDGSYLLRKSKKGGDDAFILTLKYKDQATHHNIAKEGDFVTLNKKEYGGHTAIRAVRVLRCRPLRPTK